MNEQGMSYQTDQMELTESELAQVEGGGLIRWLKRKFIQPVFDAINDIFGTNIGVDDY